MKLKTNCSTYLKVNTENYNNLSINQRISLPKDLTINVDNLLLKNDHYLITLGLDVWCLYKYHVDIVEDNINLPIDIPKQALDIIKEFEGLRLTTYLDSFNIPTIGIGTTKYENGSPVKLGDTITETRALELLNDYLINKATPILSKIPTWNQMNDNQKSAIYSFAYNLGYNFYNSSNFNSITKLCNDPAKWDDYSYVESVFIKYRNPGSSAEEGLLRRRKAEAKLFCSK